MADIRHTPDFYANSDIDWFCRINGTNIHVASMGREVPYEIELTLPNLYEQVSKIEMAGWSGKGGVWYNEELLRKRLFLEEPKRIARYLYSFVVMARKGFYSFAPITTDVSDVDYYLMAKPITGVDRKLVGIIEKEIGWIDLGKIGAFDALSLGEIIKRC